MPWYVPGGVRPLISWLSAVDDGLLRYMARHPDLGMPPKTWHHNITKETRVSYDHLKRRLKLLEEAGLVEAEDDHYYCISDLGVRYVNDEVSRDRMERLDPRPDPAEEDEEDDDDDCDADADPGSDAAEG